MEAKVSRQNDNDYLAYFNAVKYWSNALGELHYHGKHDITEAELPEQLKHAYNDLFFEGNVGSLRYLVETEKGYGIALINEYDDFTAGQVKLSMEDLFETIIQDADAIAKDPLFEKAEVFAGEFAGFNDCHELIVVFPADIPSEEFFKAASRLDELAYKTCFAKEKSSLDAKIQSAQVRSADAQKEDVLVYDKEFAQRCGTISGVDVLSPQAAADLFGKPVKDGEKIYQPKLIDNDFSR